MATIIVHGGAWAIPVDMQADSVEGCKRAASAGHEALVKGCSSLDAVEIALKVLEDDPIFNSGRGSCLTSKKEVEMDAIIVDGSSLNFGAVMSVKNIRNPISLARLVMEKTDHVALAGQGANDFAAAMGMKEVDSSFLVTERAIKNWENFGEYSDVVSQNFSGAKKRTQNDHDTVGVVAMDVHGNLAAGTSTGGITYKMPGRVGDSPFIGSGAVCDNQVGGVSSTGHGEAIAKVTLCQRILNEISVSGKSGQQCAEASLAYMEKRVGGFGGVIGITRHAEVFHHNTTEKMSWAAVDRNGVQSSGM